MGHQEVHRRIVQEILFTLPELLQAGHLEHEGLKRIQAIVQRYQAMDLPDS